MEVVGYLTKNSPTQPVILLSSCLLPDMLGPSLLLLRQISPTGETNIANSKGDGLCSARNSPADKRDQRVWRIKKSPRTSTFVSVFRLAYTVRYGCLYSTRLSIYNIDGVKPASFMRPARPSRFPHLSVLPGNGARKWVMGQPFILILCLKIEPGVPTRGKVFNVDLRGAVAIVHAPVFPRIGFERETPHRALRR